MFQGEFAKKKQSFITMGPEVKVINFFHPLLTLKDNKLVFVLNKSVHYRLMFVRNFTKASEGGNQPI
jgi:hypothetical protein